LETYTPNSETEKNVLAWCQNTLCPLSSRNIIKTFHKFAVDGLLAVREKERTDNLLDPD